MQYRRTNLLSCVFLLGLLFMVHAVAGEAEPPPPHSGFLANYGDLTEQKSGRHALFMSFTAPAASGHALKKLYLAPVGMYPAAVTFDLVDSDTAHAAVAYLDVHLREALAKRFALVATPAMADASMEVALTDVSTPVKGRTLLDLVPLRLVTKPLKDKMMGKPLQVAATLELRLTDADSGELLHSALRSGLGKGIGRAGEDDTHVTLESLTPLLDDWVEQLSEEVALAKP